ncbi:MAG: hypothetical protein K8H87_16410 [Pseudorhodoplanes sp.]|nr:hypothetical protein [Pseudorhodoplanes sp.]
MVYVLMVTLFTALGAEFDRPPRELGAFYSQEDCQREATRIEARSEHGWKFIAVYVFRQPSGNYNIPPAEAK